MKKMIIIAAWALVIFLAPIPRVANAQAGSGCFDDGQVLYSNGGEYGFNIVRAEKLAPDNPVVVTQDKKHRGVDIVVEIVAYPGTITYETYEEVCVGFDEPRDDLPKCSPFYKGGLYHYRQGRCVPHTETVYRHISGESVKAWLKPDPVTEEWMGWTTTTQGRYPLRFLFPEKWSLGTWTPDSFTATGDTGLWTDAEIDAFIASHPGFNFLKADPRTHDLPSQYLRLATDPDPLGGGTGRVIPLFGQFSEWGTNYAIVTGPDRCLVEGVGPGLMDGRGHCAKVINGADDFFHDGVDLFADDITSLTLYVENVPMDLPGKWYVGVEATVTHATYNNGKPETFDPNSMFRNSENGGYTVKEEAHSFLVYIWLTAPCNAGEEGGCDN